jgi:hypothetical protein
MGSGFGIGSGNAFEIRVPIGHHQRVPTVRPEPRTDIFRERQGRVAVNGDLWERYTEGVTCDG